MNSCMSLGFLQQILIWVVVVVVVFGLIKLLLPYILGPLGEAGTVIAGAIRLIMWGIIAIAVIYIIFALVSCMGPLTFPHR